MAPSASLYTVKAVCMLPSQSRAGTVMTFNSFIIQKYINMENNTNQTNNGEVIIYQTPDGQTNIDVTLHHETVWLSQSQMSALFKKDQSDIARHIKNAIEEGEVDESNMQILHNTFSKYRPTRVYNLDVIISVGYRVHSQEGVIFRRWATSVLKEYLIKGYAVLVALTLMIAESHTDEMETMVKVVVNLINQKVAN